MWESFGSFSGTASRSEAPVAEASECEGAAVTAGSEAIAAACEASVAAGGKATFAKAKIVTDSGKGLFPIKMKDAAIGAAYAYLRERDLFPTDDDEDDDDFVFGDEDFPSM